VNDDEPPSRVPEPYLSKYRRPVLTRVFGSLLVWLLALGAIIGGLLFWAFLTFTAPGPLAATKIYEIGKGKDRAEISVALQDQGIIADARIFSAAAAVQGLRGSKLKAGEYEFPAGATMQDVLALLTSGRFLTYKVTIPEGWTSQMVVAKLEEQKELDGPLAATPAEGTIMPDTYIYRRGLTRQKMLEDMQTANTKMIDELWAKRPADTILKSKEELVTLASIVEKETGVAEERPQVASVFINRLKQGIRLQSDPTIIYGIVGGKGRLERPLTRSDIDTETPYNTYKIPALPPGPIANPGRAALEAVLNPDKTPYLYFVANGTGGHAFAATLDEHNANVKKWRAQQSSPDPTIPDAPVAPVTPDATTGVPQPLPEVPADGKPPETVAPDKVPAVKPPEKKPPVTKPETKPVVKAVVPPEPTDTIPPEPSVDVPAKLKVKLKPKK
jgi:UPF0755 protein